MPERYSAQLGSINSRSSDPPFEPFAEPSTRRTTNGERRTLIAIKYMVFRGQDTSVLKFDLCLERG
jgi:hypothetical protein